MQLCAYACKSMQVHGFACKCMQLHRIVCICMQLHVFACRCIEMLVLACICKQVCGSACKCMQLHAFVCKCKQLHAIACNCMQLHANACSCLQLHASDMQCFASQASQLFDMQAFREEVFANTYKPKSVALKCKASICIPWHLTWSPRPHTTAPPSKEISVTACSPKWSCCNPWLWFSMVANTSWPWMWACYLYCIFVVFGSNAFWSLFDKPTSNPTAVLLPAILLPAWQ